MGYIFKPRLLGFPFSRTILGLTKGTQTDAVVIILFTFRLFAQLSDCERERKETDALFYLILSTYQKSTVRKLANCKQQRKEARLAALSSKTRLQEYFKKEKKSSLKINKRKEG